MLDSSTVGPIGLYLICISKMIFPFFTAFFKFYLKNTTQISLQDLHSSHDTRKSLTAHCAGSWRGGPGIGFFIHYLT